MQRDTDELASLWAGQELEVYPVGDVAGGGGGGGAQRILVFGAFHRNTRIGAHTTEKDFGIRRISPEHPNRRTYD